MQMDPRNKGKLPLDTDVDQLYKAVANYVEKRGGKVLVIGGIRVEVDNPLNSKTFYLAVRCTGRMPELPETPNGDS